MEQNNALDINALWNYFDELCQIPRPSKSEEKVIRYLEDFAEKHQLELRKDPVGNVLIRKPASRSMKSAPTVVLQSHMDMVGEKEPDADHDFSRDPIVQIRDDGWIRADGTTLGADDGIGIAAQLAILAHPSLEHPPIECLFTVDEESGMTGARGLPAGFFEGKIMLNLDSEDEGELFIGCAGGIDTLGSFPLKFKPTSGNARAYRISIGGFRGGHSGDEIHLSPSNAIKTLNRFLWNAGKAFRLALSHMEGGNMRNAIPREAWAIVTVPGNSSRNFEESFHRYCETIQGELSVYEPDLRCSLEQTDLPKVVLTRKKQRKLLHALYGCPHGVIRWHPRIGGLVETSTNLASVRFIGQQTALVTTSQRSSVDSAKRDIADRVASVFLLGGAEVTHSDGYPGWTPNTDSYILRIAREAYQDLFGTEPVVRAVHAGLECGLFLEKYPGLDIVSFGPTILGAHTPKERIEIASTERFWKLLLEMLRRVQHQQ